MTNSDKEPSPFLIGCSRQHIEKLALSRAPRTRCKTMSGSSPRPIIPVGYHSHYSAKQLTASNAPLTTSPKQARPV